MVWLKHLTSPWNPRLSRLDFVYLPTHGSSLWWYLRRLDSFSREFTCLIFLPPTYVYIYYTITMELPVLSSGCLSRWFIPAISLETSYKIHVSRQDALNEECICDFCLNRHREVNVLCFQYFQYSCKQISLQDATTKVPLDTVVLKGYIAELKEQNSLLRAQKARQNTAFRIGSTERPGASGSGHKRPRLESTSPVVIEIDIIEDKLSAFRDLNASWHICIMNKLIKLKSH